ncbi:amino acid permease-domain-containing protein [Aspergillus cavernicola]|uniref:Amino acid permease-domain-containing protein n=1 Tax=Aspergillus cavernicola TaxID=176166 RepID=A0ABR4IEX7_9EURO
MSRPQEDERPDWVPDWYPEPPGDNGENIEQLNVRVARPLYVSPNANRMVKRKLRGVHLFMITVNGTLGTGLYWRGGQILELAGPLAALLSFFLVGLLSWAVMQCITEMLCIWPIPGALSVYVSEFVDFELGIAVGIAYWFTYSLSFGAGIATLAAEVDFWTGANGDKAIDGVVIYLMIPLILVVINCAGVEMYGLLELVFGTAKILCLAIVLVMLIVINLGAGKQGYLGFKYWDSLKQFDNKAADNWGIAFLMCMSIATFAYVGVEIVAASALESAPDPRWARRRSEDRTGSDLSQRSHDTIVGNTVKLTAKYISLFATIAYSLSGLLVSLDIPWNHCQLPRLSWIKSAVGECVSSSNTASAFVAIASESMIPHLADVFNAFLIFACVTCASTNLYVASRTLFGLTSRLDGGKGQRWHLRILAWFGRTNSRKIPLRAMVFSSLAFVWVPFLQLRGGVTSTTPIGRFIEILAQMGSGAVVIVWACEVLAFIRYYHCISHHRSAIQQQGLSQVRRFCKDDYNDYPYRSPLQPFLAYIALAGCLFILIVANGAFLWRRFHLFPFLSSYLFVLVFIGVWIVLKLVRDARWSFVDLSKPDKVVQKLRKLHDIRLAAT